MPWTGVELAEVAPWAPAAGAVVGDYIVTVNSGGTLPSGALLPTGSFTVLHVPSETARAFSGLSTQSYDRDSVVGLGDYAFARARGSTGSNRDFRVLDPLTGTVTILSTSATSDTPVGIATAGKIIFGSYSSNQLEFYTPLGARSTLTGPIANTWGIGVGADGHIYTGSNGGVIAEIDPVTETAVATYATTMFIDGVGVQIGNRIHWAAATVGGVAFFDTDTHLWGIYAITGGIITNLVLGADGWLYGLNNSGGLAAVNPNTGARVDDTLPTALTRQGRIFSAGGHIWRPYGEPTS